MFATLLLEIDAATVLRRALVVTGAWTLLKVVMFVSSTIRQRRFTTKFAGPPNRSFVWGIGMDVMKAVDVGTMYLPWIQQYGPVFTIPSTLGSTRTMICDPRAIAYTYTTHHSFILMKLIRRFITTFFGYGLLGAEGPDHTRQRKALSPAFSNSVIRRLTPVFFDSAYKLTTAWDSILEASRTTEATIEVQHWMNRISLDSIGTGGFDYNFASLEGKTTSVSEVFASFGGSDQTFLSQALTIMSGIFPFLLRAPTKRMNLMRSLSISMKDISEVLLQRGRNQKNSDGGASVRDEKSVIGLLIKSESASQGLRMSQDEIVAQMNVLLLAGYETTSISLTWALIELSRNPRIQAKLREELAAFGGTDPTWDELTTGLPYLDAIVHETLRLRPPVPETSRVATQDELIPLSVPMATADGKMVDHIRVAKGHIITIPIVAVNRMPEFWGEDANEWIPERWLQENPKLAGLPGHRHILTFIDGPRICLGKAFALAEFKSVLSVLIRNYHFDLPLGKETVVGVHRSILLRPKFVGEDGPGVSLRVRRVVQ